LAALGSFAGWLPTNDYIDINVVSGMYLAVDKSQKIVFPYTESQLQTIFCSPLFCECMGDGMEHKEGNVKVRDWRYWVPLIALYSGARLAGLARYAEPVHGSEPASSKSPAKLRVSSAKYPVLSWAPIWPKPMISLKGGLFDPLTGTQPQEIYCLPFWTSQFCLDLRL
jgi:hypothetical protein